MVFIGIDVRSTVTALADRVIDSESEEPADPSGRSRHIKHLVGQKVNSFGVRTNVGGKSIASALVCA